MLRENTSTLQSEAIKLDSACDLFDDGHQIPQSVARSFEETEYLLEERDPGCDVTIGAAGCGGCVGEDADYVVFYIAQSPGLDERIMLKYDTPRDDTELSRRELGEVICEGAEAEGAAWSWNGSTSKSVCVGDDGAYDDSEGEYTLDSDE